MGFHIQLDLKAIEQASAVARAAGITLSDHLAGLVLMYHHVWTKRSDHATRVLLCGWFGVLPHQVDRLADALITFGHLEVRAAQPDAKDHRLREPGWRIRGAKRYLALKEKLAEGGRKSKGNLKQYSQGQEPAPARVPAEQPAPAPEGGTAEEDCWTVLERLRVDQCKARELEPGTWPRPKRFRELLRKAVDAVGIVDTLAGGEAFTRWDMLTLLFERYLAQERIGLRDEKGKPCVPPWPIPLFLSPGVLARFKQDWDEEAAA